LRFWWPQRVVVLAAVGVAGALVGCNQAKLSPHEDAGTGTDTGSPFRPAQHLGDDGDEDEEDSGDLASVMKDCGLSDETLKDPTAKVIDTSFTSFPKSYAGQKAVPIIGSVSYKVDIRTKVKIVGTVTKITSDTDFQIDAQPDEAMDEATEKVKPFKGSVESTMIPPKERLDLGTKNDDWSGIVCTVQPAKQVSVAKGGKGIVTKFEPALPFALSPKANGKRYDAELSKARTFKNIKATITSSRDKDYSEGDVITGTVTITPVTPRLTVKTSSGQSQTIETDAAFKIETNFRSKDTTVALGLFPTQTVFISHSRQDLRAIVVDSGNDEAGITVLVPDENGSN
jgi:hypothetical protein